MEGLRKKDRGGEEGGSSFRWKDTPEMARCRECSSVERDLSCLWLAAWMYVCACVWGSQYRNARQHALPSSSQLCSARSFKANRKKTITLLLCFSSMRQNDDTSSDVFIPWCLQENQTHSAGTLGPWRIILYSYKMFVWWIELCCSSEWYLNRSWSGHTDCAKIKTLRRLQLRWACLWLKQEMRAWMHF